MATNPPKDPKRVGAVKQRSQFVNPRTNVAAKRDAKTGRIMDNKTSGGTFKGARARTRDESLTQRAA